MMYKAPPVAPLSGGKASADAFTALRRVTATLPVVFNPLWRPFEDCGIVIKSRLVEESDSECADRSKLVHHRTVASKLEIKARQRSSALWPFQKVRTRSLRGLDLIRVYSH